MRRLRWIHELVVTITGAGPGQDGTAGRPHTSASRGVNYGSDNVRYPAPVRVGARIRGRAEVIEALAIEDSGVQMRVRMTVDVEDGGRPVCVADFIARYYF